jgi:hypothetical protein
VNAFIDECRAEWRRLRVPDAEANEMASDLASDLAEAEAEGLTAEEVLGTGAFDPRAFAAAWAAERGVIPSSPQRSSRLRRPVNLLVIGAISVFGALAAGMFLLASRTGSAISATPEGRTFTPPIPPDDVHRLTALDVADALAGILLLLAICGMVLTAYLWMRRRPRPPAAPA